jgi:hypothetical protein
MVTRLREIVSILRGSPLYAKLPRAEKRALVVGFIKDHPVCAALLSQGNKHETSQPDNGISLQKGVGYEICCH